MDRSDKATWNSFFNVLIPGVVIGEGVRSYTVEKVNSENIYLRAHQEAQRGEKYTEAGALRIIPTVIVIDIIHGIEDGKLLLTDITSSQKNKEEGSRKWIFEKIHSDHDPFILGYLSIISKICDYYLSNRKSVGSENSEIFDITKFLKSIKSSNIKLKDQVSCRFISGLISKPFLILTGNSGTGKTKIAQLFAQWLQADGSEDNCCLLPVGAGWTDSRNILGFYNSLSNTYQTTPALDLILKARANPAKPFFLILDEMNLSHVERYFADFLSAMESKGFIHLHSQGTSAESADGKNIPDKFEMPQNLFVIGTVNVDETTYMFSPKVLDRANVIEFRVSKDDISSFIDAEASVRGELERAEPGTEEAFLLLSERARGLNDNAPLADPENADELKNALKDIFEILHTSGFEFAYRAAEEIMRFARVSYELADEKDGKKIFSIEEIIDAQILQKILPKLHGSKKRIEPVIAALVSYCGNKDKNAALKQIVSINQKIESDNPVYKDSFKKLSEMLAAVRRDQFVSFIQ